ncbi:MAG: substrate-binding domain-containing protein [Acidaminococcaceae bacterium]|nr:substrate-binding domain-containing protein [Acidaminococcaceae bacterium]
MLKRILSIFLLAIFCSITSATEAIVVDKRPVLIGFSILQENDITKAMLNGAKKAVGKLNAKLIVRDGRGDVDVQMAQIHDLIAQETGCLVVVYDDIKANGRIVESGKNKGTPVVLVEGKVTDKKAAFDAAKNAVEEVYNKVRSKKVQPAFYSGY